MGTLHFLVHQLQPCVQLWLLLIGLMARDPKEVVRYMSVARAVEEAGQCIARDISPTSSPVCKAFHRQMKTVILTSAQLTVPLGLNFALWGVAAVPGFLVVRQAGILHCGPDKTTASE